MIKDKLFYSLNSDLLEGDMRDEMKRRKTRYTKANKVWDAVMGILATVLVLGFIIGIMAITSN